MWTQPKSNQCCLTCANWGGDRRAEKIVAAVDDAGKRGPCYEKAGSQGTYPSDGRQCSQYRLWGAIR